MAIPVLIVLRSSGGQVISWRRNARCRVAGRGVGIGAGPGDLAVARDNGMGALTLRSRAPWPGSAGALLDLLRRRHAAHAARRAGAAYRAAMTSAPPKLGRIQRSGCLLSMTARLPREASTRSRAQAPSPACAPRRVLQTWVTMAGRSFTTQSSKMTRRNRPRENAKYTPPIAASAMSCVHTIDSPAPR